MWKLLSQECQHLRSLRARNNSFPLDDRLHPLPLLPLRKPVSTFEVPSQQTILLDLINPDEPILRRERLLEVVQSRTGGCQMLVADPVDRRITSEKLAEPTPRVGIMSEAATIEKAVDHTCSMTSCTSSCSSSPATPGRQPCTLPQG